MKALPFTTDIQQLVADAQSTSNTGSQFKINYFWGLATKNIISTQLKSQTSGAILINLINNGFYINEN